MWSPKWGLWNHSRKQTEKMWNVTNMRCFMLRHKSSLRGRAWEGECWQLCVEWQSESLLHKATVEAGLALEPELLKEEAKKVSLWLSQCQIWLGNAGNGDGARLIFSARCQLNKELCGLLARVEVCTNSQPKSYVRAQAEWAKSSLDSSFLGLCCTWRPGRAQRGDGTWVCDYAGLVKFDLLKGGYWWLNWLYW